MTATPRTLALLLWWSPVKYVFPVLLAIDLGCLWSRPAQWRGTWAATIDWAGGSMLLLGPLVAGLAAWRTVASGRGLGEAADVGERAWRAQGAEALGVVGWAAAAHLLTLCVAIVASIDGGARGAPNLLPALPQLAVLLGYTAVGVIAACLVANPLTAPLVAVTTLFLVTQFSPGSRGELLVSVGGATTALSGLHYNVQVLTAQTLLGVALGLLVVGVHRTSVGRLLVRPAPVLGAIVPGLLIGSWLAAGPEQYVRDRTPPALSCVGSGPRVCVLPGQEKAGQVLHSIWSREIATSRTAGVSGFPIEFDQVDSATQLPRGHRAFSFDQVQAPSGAINPVNATFYFVIDRGACLSGDAPPPSAAIERLETAAAYLLVESGIETVDDSVAAEAAGIMRLRAGTRRSWLAAVLAAASRCAFDQVPAPPIED